MEIQEIDNEQATNVTALIWITFLQFEVPVYHELGFVDTDSEQLTDGMKYTPMKFKRQLPV